MGYGLLDLLDLQYVSFPNPLDWIPHKARRKP